MKRLTITLIGGAVCLACLGLYCALPGVAMVQVVGVEVKREDAEQRTRAAYMINAQLADGGAVRVFRNQDPLLYLKFHSANAQADATGFSHVKAVEAVAIRQYWWRIAVPWMFPNAISAWPVEPGYRHISLFKIGVILLILTGVFFAWRAIRWARVLAKLTRSAVHRVREAARCAVPSFIDSVREGWLLRDRPDLGLAV
jgi:hypothetical protein